LSFVSHWTEAKLRLGDQASGATVEEFIVKNTKIIAFDPWENRDAKAARE